MLDLSNNARKAISASPIAMSSAVSIAVSVLVVFLQELLHVKAWVMCGVVPKILFLASSAESWRRTEVCNAYCEIGFNRVQDRRPSFVQNYSKAAPNVVINLRKSLHPEMSVAKFFHQNEDQIFHYLSHICS